MVSTFPLTVGCVTKTRIVTRGNACWGRRIAYHATLSTYDTR